MLFSNKEKEEEDYINNNQNPSIILQRIRKMETYSDILRKPNRDLFNKMIQSAYKYSSAIDAKCEDYATEYLLMSIQLENYKNLLKY
jgi:hypothetical protein